MTLTVSDTDLQAENLPPRMRRMAQWLVWRFEQFPGDKKPRKVPYYINGTKRHGVQGSDEDRAELASFDVAVAVVQGGWYSGIGFAFLPGDGLIGIDIDGAIDADTGEVSERCQAIIGACASYTEFSPSGRGVHIIVEGESETFKDNAIGLEVFCGRQYFTCTGRRWPGTPDDVRPIDDGVLRRLKITVKGSKAAPRAAAPLYGKPAGDDLAQRLESALPYVSPDMPHDDWVAVGMALKAALGDGGFRMWDYWSSRGAKYPGSELLQRKWASFTGSGVTEATVFHLAIAAGWRAPKPTGGKPSMAQPVGGVQEPPADDQPAADDGASTPSSGSAKVGKGKKGREISAVLDALLIKGSHGSIKDCRENVFLALKHAPELEGLIGYDEFSHRAMKRRPPPWKSEPGEWTTADDYLLGLWLTTNLRLEVRSEATLVAGVAMIAHENKFHPVRDYLDGLPQWDGVDRLRHWMHECLGAKDDDYTHLVGRWFVMGLVRRIREPGCQNDYMVVLEGLQGKRKSTSLRTLVGNSDWFADTPIRIGDKDALLSLAGKWLYEVGELDSFNRAEATAVKQYLSSRVDRVREPFARRPSDRPRSCVFAGTTNQGEYLKDPTGARRFWPVACDGEIDLPKLEEWRDQLFAEAIACLASDDAEVRRCWPNRDEEARYLVPEQEQREIGDPWFERIAQWINSGAKFGDTLDTVGEVESFTTHDLLTKCLGVPSDRIDGGRQMSTRVGIAMHKLGWAKARDAHGPRLWRYVRPGKGGKTVQTAAGGPAIEEKLDEF